VDSAALNRAISEKKERWVLGTPGLACPWCESPSLAFELLAELLALPATDPRIEMIRPYCIQVSLPEPAAGTMRIGTGRHTIYFDALEPRHVAEAWARVNGVWVDDPVA
jgi:hypothetical protein